MAATGTSGAEEGEESTLRIATFNIYNYGTMDRMFEGRWRFDYPKPEEEKAALRAILRNVRPDVVVLQEMGASPFLEEFREDLRREGLDFPYGEVLEAMDTDRYLAFLSKIPPLEVRGHTDLDFAYRGGREWVKRGLQEIIFESEGERWSIFNLHLKSKWTEYPEDPLANQKRIREAEAIRNYILSEYDPAEDGFIILGDVNDTLHSSALRRLRQRGAVTISEPLPAVDRSGLTWTQRWERAGLYSRIDYILVSPAWEERVVPNRYRVYDGPKWSLASDHRMVYADLVWPGRQER